MTTLPVSLIVVGPQHCAFGSVCGVHCHGRCPLKRKGKGCERKVGLLTGLS